MAGGEQINGSLKQDTGDFPTDSKPATPSLQASEVQTHPVNRATKFSGSYRQTVGSSYWRYRGRTRLPTQRISFSMDRRSGKGPFIPTKKFFFILRLRFEIPFQLYSVSEHPDAAKAADM